MECKMEYSNSTMIYVVLAVLVLILIGYLIYRSMNSKDDNDSCHEHGSSQYTDVSKSSKEERCNEWWW